MKPRCQNCDTPLVGDFCSKCGQSGRNFDVPVTDFAREFASETLSLDSRLRSTLRQLFFRPGAVPKGFVEGQRARYVPPVRLYVFASFAMFLVLSFGEAVVDIGELEETPTEVVSDSMRVGPDTVAVPPETVTTGGAGLDTLGAGDTASTTLGERLGQRFFDSWGRVTADREGFAQTFLNRLAQAMFFLLPAFAAILKLAYRRRLYVHHLVFSVYLHCFVFLLVAAASTPQSLGLDTVAEVTDFAVLWVPPYLFLGMRRFYGESTLRTALKFGFVSAAYFAVWGATMIALLFVSLMTF